jgi:phosphoglycolate phosphatase-like HAD superfamily hydrolase
MTRHVIFDFDGVLCNSLAVCIEEYERLRLSEFPELPQVSLPCRMDGIYHGLLKHSLDKWIGHARTVAFFDLHSAAMDKRSGDVEVFPGVRKLLESMPAQSASIVSSARDSLIKRVLSVDGKLPRSLAFIEGRETRESKSDKILRILQSMRLSSHDAFYVGDLESDLLYCQQIPMRCVLVTYGYHTANYLAACADSAYAVIGSVEQLTALICEEILGRSSLKNENGRC